MTVLRYLLTAWICSISVYAGLDSYGTFCNPPCKYDRQCVDGNCVCRSGNDHFGKCVECTSPKVYKACPTNCPRTCDDDPNKPISCTKECDLSRYCVCPDGYVERSKTDSTCVRKEECPLYCKPPKISVSCIPGCIGTCENPNGRPGCRDDICAFAISCVCPGGYVQKSETDSTCVKLKDCPKRCEAPKVYTGCATSCPETCDNIGQGPIPCILRCRVGVNCVCPKGYVELSNTDSTCVKRSACPCQLPKDPGPCEALIPRFYFNSNTKKCESFIYGGCQGNANRFKTKKDCEASCPVCQLMKDPGPCEAAIPRYFYNKATGDCEKFLYGGCEGNANRFESLSQCREACAVDPCIFTLCLEGTVCKGGICIEICQKPKKYTNCATSCPTTCENVNDPPTICTADCRPGISCVCPKGYVEKSSTDSTCVMVSKCPQNQCKFPKVYEECPTSCPETCDTIGQTKPRPCIAACRFGVNCVCPRGYVEISSSDSTCVKRSACPCQLPKDSGPCEALMPMFYFNAQIGKCQRFNYGGCQGNANRFKSRRDCEDACSICKLDKDPGPCKAAMRRYFYNKKTGRCERFLYGGCRGNANRFESLDRCKKTCEDPCARCPLGYVCRNGRCVDLYWLR